MNYVQASDDYLMYLEVEKNYSVNTISSYAFDLKLYGEFLIKNGRSLDLDKLTTSSVRRFIQDQVINHGIKPRTLQRRLSCLKSFSQGLIFILINLPVFIPKNLLNKIGF
ncbi:site-specific integrase [Neobacillus ginsengisoli]|uniref:Integrase/recombinase XerD n=1 Tax=Neobacillus ginsengisoli TaxID=904295 RepID=A0ABT9XWX7_9BACI|nr:site-specific integrase [Neobacillus ginsengisoli]MDQ0200006.1 integrase/recombinase XerD [Neobacillus ginsengisoli]